MILTVLLFIVGLICLVKGGDWFVDGATNFARRLHLPEILVGATVVSIGTTLPEVMVSATSAATGHGDLAYGNAIGSIICNTALIAAITMAIRPSKIDRKSLVVPSIAFFTAAAVYMAVSYLSGYFSRFLGIVLLLMFCVYIFISVKQSLKQYRSAVNEPAEEKKLIPVGKMILFLLLGAALIAVGARLLVDNGTKIAVALGVPESVVALTMVALGTSLPELVTAITSLAKGHSELSVGNIIGANLFNLVLVGGLSITISPFEIPSQKTLGGINSALVVDLPLMLATMLIMIVPALTGKRLYRWQGLLLLALYAGFVVYQFTV